MEIPALPKAVNLTTTTATSRLADISIGLHIILGQLLLVIALCLPAPNALAAYSTGNNDRTLDHDGLTRTYTSYRPAGLSGPAPLIIDLHGNGSNGYQQQHISGWDDLADSEKFIVAYPDGTGTENISIYKPFPGIEVEVDVSSFSWNAGICCSPATDNNVDDLGFIIALVDAIEAEATIDASRVYVTGLSNGGAMAQKLACDATDGFAGFAPLASPLPVSSAQCNPSKDVPLMQFMGLTDQLIAYTPNAVNTFEAWRGFNGCDVGSASTTYPDGLNPDQNHCVVDESCNSGVDVALCSIHGSDSYDFVVTVDVPVIGEIPVSSTTIPAAGHILYFNEHNTGLAEIAWSFLQSQTTTAPDLVVINPGVNNGSLETGESFTLSATSKNQGTASADASTLRYYRSNNATIDTGDAAIGTDSVSGLPAGAEEGANLSATAPLTPGTYWVGACVDTVTGESNMGNQCSTGVQITVFAPAVPDLVVISPGVDDSTLEIGQAYILSATSRNQGTASAASTTLRYYRSDDATITGSDMPLGADDVGGLAASASEPDSIPGTAPGNPGTWWLGACVDAVTGESNIDNQCSGGVQITVSEEPDSRDPDQQLCFPLPAGGRFSVICL